MAFTLVMLGTGTHFTPNPDQDYSKGELLSVISTLISTSRVEVYDLDKSWDVISPYITDNVEVIIGPATLGLEVANRIQAGVSAILKAIAHGETEINIIAHSRGAIEAILIAHQINDIKNAYSQLQEQDGVIKVLGNVLVELAQKESPDVYGNTGEILQTVSRNVEFKNQDLFGANFKQVILNTNINLLGIDPVPGDFKIWGYLEWIDSRFYKIPAIVKDCEIYLYENERSRAFTPVLPVVISKEETELQVIPIPGHHGTGSSGHNTDQQRNIVPEQGDTTHVQLLLFFKIMSFLNKHGVIFQKPSDWPTNSAGLPAKALGCLDNLDEHTVIEGPDSTRFFSTVYFRLYSDIFNNRKAYEYFNTTYYSFLPPEVSNSPRYIYHGSKEKKTFSTVFPSALGYVNDDHVSVARQLILKILDMQQLNGSLSAIALKVSQQLLNSIITYSSSVDTDSSSSHSSGIEASDTDVVKILLDNEAGQKQIIDSLSILIDKISNKYLNDFLDEEEKRQLRESLDIFLCQFAEKQTFFSENTSPKSGKINQFMNELIEKIKEGLGNTLIQQYERLKEEETWILKPLLAILSVDEIINTNVQNALLSLILQLRNETEKQPLDEENAGCYKKTLQNFINKDANKIINQRDRLMEIWRLFKEDEYALVELLRNKDYQNKLDAVTEQQLFDLYQLEVDKTNPSIAIANCEAFCQKLENFKIGLPYFKSFNLKFDIPTIQMDLEKTQWYLMHKAAEFWNSRNEGSQLPGQANISHYLQDLNIISTSANKIREDNHQLTTQNSDLNQQLAAEKNELERTKIVITEVKEQNHQLTIQVAELNQQLAVEKTNKIANHRRLVTKNLMLIRQQQEQKEKNADLEQVISLKNRKIDDFDQNLEQKQNTIDELSNAINEEQEAELLLLINKKLWPLTLAYENHLNKLADSVGKKDKLEAIGALKNCLTDRKNHILPSQRVLAFYTQLQQSDAVIKEHRDQAWVRYLRNTVLVAGTILTGLLPGLLLLGLYSTFSSKQSLLFWKSHGEILSKEYHRYESMCPSPSH